jgi:anti-sigma B factor antagonist
MTRLSVTGAADGLVHVTFPAGRADGTAVRELFEALAVIFERPGVRLLLDFTGVDHLTSGMIGMLVTTRKRAMPAGGRVAVALPDPLLMQQLSVTNLQRVLTVTDSVEAARTALLSRR